MEFSLSAEQEKEWAAFDDWAVSYLAKNSYRLFKAIKTEEQIRENYRSPVQKKGDYRATLRCKVNTDGAHRCAVGTWQKSGLICLKICVTQNSWLNSFCHTSG